MKKVLLLTTSVFTDRMLQHSTFLDDFKKEFEVEIWAKSFVSNPEDWNVKDITVDAFPNVNPLPHWIGYLRRINEYAWMYNLNAESIIINNKYKVKTSHKKNLFLTLGKILCLLNLHKFYEKFIFKIVKKYSRNKQILKKIKDSSIDYIVVFNPFWVEEPVIAIEAQKLSIPIVSIIPSWDNITTKSRMVYKSDFYGVWSSIRIKELNEYYPYTLNKDVFVYGAPQYDLFWRDDFKFSKQQFIDKYNLNPDLPILLYTLGSPLFITTEIDVCIKFCKLALENGLLDNYQVLIRPHPIKDFSTFVSKFNEIDKRIKIQLDVQTPKEQKNRFMNNEMLKNWVSTFYYSEIIVATSSTTILDASMYNKPHINITENLSDDRKYDAFLKDVSYKFEHLRKLNNEKLLNNVKTWDEFIKQLLLFSQDKKSIMNKSNEIVLHLCEFQNSGNYGKIFSTQLIKILKTNVE